MAPRRPVGLTPRGGGSWGIVASGRIELLVKTLAAVSEESGFQRGGYGSRGLREGRFGANDALGEKACSVGRKRVYVFNRWKDKRKFP